MGDIGTDGQEINAKGFQIYIGSTANQWRLLQNARVSIGHPIFREPTTDGGVVLFTGAADHNISGTLVFTRDEWNTNIVAGVTNISGFRDLLAVTNGEVPIKSWIVKFTDTSGSATNTTLTFTNCKLSVTDINKSPEGGTKIDITVVCPDEPTTA